MRGSSAFGGGAGPDPEGRRFGHTVLPPPIGRRTQATGLVYGFGVFEDRHTAIPEIGLGLTGASRRVATQAPSTASPSARAGGWPVGGPAISRYAWRRRGARPQMTPDRGPGQALDRGPGQALDRGPGQARPRMRSGYASRRDGSATCEGRDAQWKS